MATANPKIVITASDQTKSAFDSVNRSLSTMSSKATDVGKSFKSIGALALTAFSGAGLVNLVKGVIDAQGRLEDLSKSTAISIEDLAGLSSAAQKSGGDLNSIADSINKLSVNIGREPEKFRQIGITAKEPIEAFKQLADVFVRIKDPQERAAFAAEALGKSWQGAAPALSEGSKKLGEMIEKGKALAKATTDSAVALGKLDDELIDLRTTSDQVALKFTNSLAPSLLATAKAMNELVDQGNPLLALMRGFAGLGKIPFDLAFGSIDNSVKGQIADLEKTLGELKTKASRAGTGGGGIINEFVFGKKGEFDQQILVVQNQIEALKKFGDVTKKKPNAELVGPPPDLAGFLGKNKPEKTGGGARAVRTKKDDPYTDLLTPSAEAYAKAIEAINASNLNAEKSTLKLNDAEEILYDLMRSTVWRDMPESWKELVIAQSEAASAAIKTAEKTKELNDLLGATPTAKLEETRGKMLLLADAFEAGKITAEQFSEAAQTALGTISDLAQEATDEMSEFAVQAARNMQDAFAEFLFDPFKDGTENMLKNFGTMIQKMVANAVAADLAKRLFGSLSGGDGDGWIGGLLKGIFNAKGNVYDSPGLSSYSGSIVSKPTIFPFASGIGLMGEAGAEAILPLKRGTDGKLGVSAGGGSTINVYVTGTNAPDVRRAAGQGAREAMAAMAGAGRYN